MLTTLFELARPMLFALDPEDAHELTLKSLEMGVYPRPSAPDDPALGVKLWGLGFKNPLGVAAGFDKDARVADAVIGMGFGFAEIGTTTPLAQAGNPRPRVFRLVRENAVINRLGFNNGGHERARAHLTARPLPGIVGVNIGANKEAADRVADYVRGLEVFSDVASYITINISSPNTPGLRDLQAPHALDALLSRVMAARAKLADAGRPQRPIVVKISPDIADEDIAPIVDRLLAHKVDAIAVSNTTLSRSGVSDAAAREAGGLSGRPLFERSTIALARVYQASGGKIPLIGIGGIDSGERALAKIEAGATLLQLYTGLIYQGPGLVGRIKEHLTGAVRRANVASVGALVGTRAAEWARKTIT